MKVIAAMMMVFLLASHMEIAVSGPEDCMDACTTGCVNANDRLRARCDRKCVIRCGPDAETQKADLGLIEN